MKRCVRYEISGLVQGVGFRPFIYNLALKFNLFGEVYNDDEGVKLTLYGKDEALAKFDKAVIDELPSLARIDQVLKFELDGVKFSDFKIIASKSAKKHAPILPDFALCVDCEREFYDPKNPRYHYPFINCTNCGPRFSIIKSLPYDRINTTMNEFKMCEFCGGEYKDPTNRRYHAQPISCPNCGPSLSLKDKFGKIVTAGNESVKTAAELINEGKILAIKGLGGFHLVCDATNEQAVSELRARKHRPKKPFAIMCKNLQNAKKHAYICPAEEQILTSNLKPIVVLQSRAESNLSKQIAPNLNKIGIFLPYTGVHLLLFEYLKNDIVATSANISGEPIIYNEASLLEKMSDVIDYYLDNNREIESPSDDSIVFVVDDEPVFLRTSRGVNPKFLHTNFKDKRTILAVGAELKNQFAIHKDGEVMISPYIGDLKNVATYERFCSLIELFEQVYELKFDEIVADLHPHFLNLKWAKEYAAKNGAKITQIQHHYAHLLSVMFEHNLDKDKKYLGFCFDGTGYGGNNTIWGGEILLTSSKKYERIFHFDEFLLLGGESSIKNIYKIAYSIILKYHLEETAKEFLKKFDQNELKNLKTMHDKKINSIATSSLGRIFDAFGSIILGLKTVSYEGEIGMELEALYDESIQKSYKFELDNQKIVFKEAFKSALKDDKKTAATAFINGLCDIVTQIAKIDSRDVLLSGGVFQNRVFLRKIINSFKNNSIKYYFNKTHPINDSSIATGQLYYSLNNL
ncbi:carbamoyltransferase HypF [Campylobacter sp. RM16187]|uniref:carbamoyltransferase HypF n=1 Tax=Campylobacter sp. RM16187 TaxID=1660063 RepID=UPI0021B5DB22|nr:carbamoyltransferase HypF [Campylobacter sp. RM16187]QKG29273.1 [NiFe] hydrogenase maturation protein HypF [Campylobacter sp. RM16187]